MRILLVEDIDVNINRLRRKIDDGFAHQLIHTRRGEGYMLIAPDEPRQTNDDAAETDKRTSVEKNDHA